MIVRVINIHEKTTNIFKMFIDLEEDRIYYVSLTMLCTLLQILCSYGV